jgi:hypothetical protein
MALQVGAWPNWPLQILVASSPEREKRPSVTYLWMRNPESLGATLNIHLLEDWKLRTTHFEVEL